MDEQVTCSKCKTTGRINDFWCVQSRNVKTYECKDERTCITIKLEYSRQKQQRKTEELMSKYNLNPSNLIMLKTQYRDGKTNYYDPVSDMTYSTNLFGGKNNYVPRPEMLAIGRVEYANRNNPKISAKTTSDVPKSKRIHPIEQVSEIKAANEW